MDTFMSKKEKSQSVPSELLSKELKEFMSDMNEIYTSVNREQAEAVLVHFEQKWGSKYRHALQSWQRNWNDPTAFLTSPWR